ncbi:MAG: hypothetical protein JWQ84_1303 [Mucilaginibacter sp.]|nr:hypothetical protein [Mucilaginibacter sp.]MDB5016471.1 hypothetical protein [Mucilaginibacter sp.]MDB5139380.1 hypothetical protein [Mucilaginibacter sp.]
MILAYKYNFNGFVTEKYTYLTKKQSKHNKMPMF